MSTPIPLDRAGSPSSRRSKYCCSFTEPRQNKTAKNRTRSAACKGLQTSFFGVLRRRCKITNRFHFACNLRILSRPPAVCSGEIEGSVQIGKGKPCPYPAAAPKSSSVNCKLSLKIVYVILTNKRSCGTIYDVSLWVSTPCRMGAQAAKALKKRGDCNACHGDRPRLCHRRRRAGGLR